MAELKTKLNDGSVTDFLNKIEDEDRRKDCFELLSMMQDVTGDEPKMWGESIIGFGSYQYKYASGREGEWFQLGFSPRKQNISLYTMCGFDHAEKIMGKLGRYKTGKSCIYVKKLDDIDRKALMDLFVSSVNQLTK